MEQHRGRLAHHPRCTCHPTHHQRSSPIEIPTRRKSTIVQSPPRNVATSPELIFDMSPPEYVYDYSVSSIDRPVVLSHRRRDERSSRGEEERDASLRCIDSIQPKSAISEPFLYSFPVLHSHQPPSKPGRSAVPKLKGCRDALDTPGNVTRSIGESCCETHRLDRLCHDGERSPSPTQTHFVFPPRATRKATAPRIVEDKAKKTLLRSIHGCRSPPPPLSSSLFGSNSTCSFGESVAKDSSPTDPDKSSFGFERYLLRRIDNERSVRVSHRQPISSLRISARALSGCACPR